MNARMKRKTAAQDAVAGEDGLIVVEVLSRRPIFDDNGNIEGWIRRVIVEPKSELQRQPEALRSEAESTSKSIRSASRIT